MTCRQKEKKQAIHFVPFCMQKCEKKQTPYKTRTDSPLKREANDWETARERTESGTDIYRQFFSILYAKMREKADVK